MESSNAARVLLVANKTTVTEALIAAVRARAASGPAEFFLLIPNPDHVLFDRISENTSAGEQVLALALPMLSDAAGTEVEGRVAHSPNAYDDIEQDVRSGNFDEIILETIPTHVSHWLHVDLAHRVAAFGLPLTTVSATH
jgi:hypothetical protein